MGFENTELVLRFGRPFIRVLEHHQDLTLDLLDHLALRTNQKNLQLLLLRLLICLEKDNIHTRAHGQHSKRFLVDFAGKNILLGHTRVGDESNRGFLLEDRLIEALHFGRFVHVLEMLGRENGPPVFIHETLEILGRGDAPKVHGQNGRVRRRLQKHEIKFPLRKAW